MRIRLILPLFLVFLIVVFNITLVYADVNLLQNAGFETGSLYPWYDGGTGGAVSNINPFEGNYCYRVGYAYAPTAFVAQGWATPYPPVNNVSLFSFWVKAYQSYGSYFKVKFTLYSTPTGGVSSGIETDEIFVDNVWTYFDLTDWLIANGHDKYMYEFSMNKGNNEYLFYIDYFALMQESGVIPTEPETSTIMTRMVLLVVPFIFVLVPALLLAELAGKNGLIVGILLGVIVLFIAGWMPLWILFLVGLGIILLLLHGRGGGE